MPGHHAAQDKITSHHSALPDVALPDLSVSIHEDLVFSAFKMIYSNQCAHSISDKTVETLWNE